jgi:hypothetical protein
MAGTIFCPGAPNAIARGWLLKDNQRNLCNEDS